MLNIKSIREYCLNKNGVSESFPFDEVTLVFKVMNKMFCLANITSPLRINLKCSPEMAIELRERYAAVIPGYHMNKRHWNTIMIDNIYETNLIWEWIDNSYHLVTKSLTKKDKLELQKLLEE